jgi:hypothetical protein
MKTHLLSGVLVLLATTVPGWGQGLPLAERFANPPAESRILPMTHRVPDALEQQDALLRGLQEKGFGGMVTNVPFDGYLEDEAKWQAFVRTVGEAKKQGLSLWLYDEKGYPSGNAGGITMRDHPEWEARGRLIAEADTQGGAVALDAPPGTLVRAVAFPTNDGVIQLDAATDLASFVKDGKLAWDAPQGSWHVMLISEDRLYEGTHAAVSLADKLPYINLLMREPTARFLEVTHQRYAQHLGDDLGRYFVSTFTDEPSLMSMFMRPQPWRVLPWSPDLAAQFEKRRGYALEPVFPALAADAGPKGQAARYDFWLTVGELVSENYFGQIQEWCKPHNILSGGHLLYEESIVKHVPLYGDFFRCARRLDAPGIDCLTSIPEEVPWYIARLIGSVADIEGRAVTMCETSDHSQRYRPEGDTRPVRVVSEDEIRGTINRLVQNGINTITSYYQFKDLSQEQIVRLNEWTGRCCTALKGGHQIADVAVLYPIESVWAHFEPASRMVIDAPAAAHRVERNFNEASQNLYTSGRDFTYIDSRTLTEARVEEGRLKFKDLAWRAIVLPAADTLPLAAWERVAEFWRAGGIVVSLAARPANSEKEFPSAEVQRIADEIFGTAPDGTNRNEAGGCGIFLPSGMGSMLPTVLDALLARDVTVSGKSSPIRATHRAIDGNQIYFLVNDGREPWEGTVTFAASGKGEQLDPATGQQSPVDPAQPISLKLGPFGGMLYRFDAAKAPERLPLGDKSPTSIEWKAFPDVVPTVGAGEFVRGSIEELSTVDGRMPAWKTQGIITKGNTDTFLFAVFDYPKPVDLSQAAFLGFAAQIAKPQEASKPLLIVLRDAKGVDGLVETELGLGEVGTHDIRVSISRVAPAGWNKDPQQKLDMSAIVSLKVGWGGYYGKENETVEFAFSRPELGVINAKPATAKEEVLYNGIRLPAEWPPRYNAVPTREVMPVPYLDRIPEVIPIDLGRQLFVDDFLIEPNSLRRTFHAAQYYSEEPVLKPEQPWEMDGVSGDYPMPTAMVFSDGVWYDPQDRLFKLWYMGGHNRSTCYATSTDGIHWEKPSLDVVPGTNIVNTLWRDSNTVWLDLDEKDPARRYKMFASHMAGKDKCALALFFSADGIHWGEQVADGGLMGDRSTAFYNPFRKVWVYSIKDTYYDRRRRYQENPDVVAGLNWNYREPPLWVGMDRLDYWREGEVEYPQLYNLDAVAYESLMIGLFSLWHGPGGHDRPKPNEVGIGFSRDGFHWYRPFREAFVPISDKPGAWNFGNVQSAGGCCLVVGDKLHFYVSGRSGIPGSDSNTSGTCSTGLATLRRDGFASMDVGEEEQRLTTRPLLFHGNRLFVNADCPDGELRVEVLDIDRNPVAPYTRDECNPVQADTTRAAVTWKNATDLSAVAGKPVRLRFHLRKGSLYSFWVTPDASGASHGYVAAGGPGFTSTTDTVGSGG